MSGQLRAYKQKIRATSTLKKVFRAMELIAASRIGKARDRSLGQDPYTQALTRAIATVSAHAREDHPMLNERTDTNKVIVFVVTSDRGMAGPYSPNVLRAADKLLDELKEEGKEPLLYVYGRRGVSYYNFRGVPIEQSWIGESEKPTRATSAEIGELFQQLFLAEAEEGGVAELHVVYTRYINMVQHPVEARRMLPLELVDADIEPIDEYAEDAEEFGNQPLYEFEPSATEVFDAILPMYVNQRVHQVLVSAAASELASRQQAMHAAVENADELVNDYTRLANNARQAQITTEITEIISGADALGRD